MTLFLRLLGIAVICFIAAPLVVVVPMSFSTAESLQFPPPGYWLGYYAKYFTDPNWLRPTWNSILIASATAVLTMALTVPACFAIVRHSFHGKSIANVLLMLPLAVPSIVMAIGYYSYFGQIGIVHSHIGVILAHTSLAVPLAFLVLSANLKGFDRNLERAAMSLGATPAKAFLHVTLPILRPGLAVATLFSFIQSFDETVVAIFISGRDATTLPRKMFDSIREETDPVIAAVSTLLFAAVLAAVTLPYVWGWVRRRMGARRAATAVVPVPQFSEAHP